MQYYHWMNISGLSGTLHASFLNWLLIGHLELTMDRTLLYPKGPKLFTLSLLNLPFSVGMGGVSKVRFQGEWKPSLAPVITLLHHNADIPS